MALVLIRGMGGGGVGRRRGAVVTDCEREAGINGEVMWASRGWIMCVVKGREEFGK